MNSPNMKIFTYSVFATFLHGPQLVPQIGQFVGELPDLVFFQLE
jgi:hypothetical protein